MGTRGAVGFRIDGQDKLTYNHFDSYPSGLGEDVAAFIRAHQLTDPAMLEVTRSQVRDIEMVSEEAKPTPEQIARFSKFFQNVGTGKHDDWYALLRGIQGDLDAYLSEGVMIKGGEEFMKESLFCEWAYVINLDTSTLEVYEGYQMHKGKGRYAASVKKPRNWKPDYVGAKFFYPVTLIAEIPFADVPESEFEVYLRKIGAVKNDESEV